MTMVFIGPPDVGKSTLAGMLHFLVETPDPRYMDHLRRQEGGGHVNERALYMRYFLAGVGYCRELGHQVRAVCVRTPFPSPPSAHDPSRYKVFWDAPLVFA